MTMHELVKRVGETPLPVAGAQYLPPPALVALFVKGVRDFKCLKKSALASLAGVSLSTVERIERGEYVSPDSLDMVSVALGLPFGAFTDPRTAEAPLTAAKELTADLKFAAMVKVAPLKSQAHLRALARGASFAVLSYEDTDDLAKEAEGLMEEFEKFSAAIQGRRKPADGRRREAYGELIDHADGMAARGLVVVGGLLNPISEASRAKDPIAVFAITRRANDPAGYKRRVLIVDSRQFENVVVGDA